MVMVGAPAGGTLGWEQRRQPLPLRVRQFVAIHPSIVLEFCRQALAQLASLRTLAAAADGGLGTWLAELHLGEDVAATDEAERVLLTTIHGAKGGEWRRVFVLGVEEGLLPHARALLGEPGERDGVEAERRVAYVAVTRPREGLYLLCCRTRRRGERPEPLHPSRFLRGLPLARAA